MNSTPFSLELLYCPDCRVGVDATYSMAKRCPHCQGPRILLASQISSLLPEETLTSYTLSAPVETSTPPLPDQVEELIFRAQQQMIK